MKYFIKFLLIIATFYAIVGCSKIETESPFAREADSQIIGKARNLFDKEVKKISLATKGNGNKSAVTFDAGGIFVQWNYASIYENKAKKLKNVEVPIVTANSYVTIQTTESGSILETNCYNSLLIVQNLNGQSGVYIMWYIPSVKYYTTHPGNPCEIFKNDGNMGDYCGLKIYTKLNGSIVRVNKYLYGKKVSGLFFPGIKSKEGKIKAKINLYNLLSDIRFKGKLVNNTRYRIPGEDFEYDIEESICWGDEENEEEEGECDPDDAEDEGDDGYEDEEKDTRNVTIHPIALNEHLTISGQKYLVDALVSMIEKEFTNQTTPDIISTLIKQYGNKIYITVDRNNEKMTTKPIGSTNNTCSSVIITYHMSCDAHLIDIRNELYEELLHAKQYVTEGNSWLKGDMEFEAKVFDSILYVEYGIFFGFDRSIADIFYSYYLDPSIENFQAALNAMYSNPFEYTKEKYPVSNNIFDRLEHIRNFF